MDQTKFWNIIEEAQQKSSGKLDRQIVLIEDSLWNLSLMDVETFERIYLAFYDLSYRDQLWQAIGELVGFVSDDSFDYFRAWLIAQGEYVFCKVVQDPGRLHEFLNLPGEWTLESLNYVAFSVYEARLGLDLWEMLNKRYMENYFLTGYEWLQPNASIHFNETEN